MLNARSNQSVEPSRVARREDGAFVHSFAHSLAHSLSLTFSVRYPPYALVLLLCIYAARLRSRSSSCFWLSIVFLHAILNKKRYLSALVIQRPVTFIHRSASIHCNSAMSRCFFVSYSREMNLNRIRIWLPIYTHNTTQGSIEYRVCLWLIRGLRRAHVGRMLLTVPLMHSCAKYT